MSLSVRDKKLRGLRDKLNELQACDKDDNNLKDAISNILNYLKKQEILEQNSSSRIQCAKQQISSILKDLNNTL